MAEAKTSRLADIINVIGAETYKRIFSPVSLGITPATSIPATTFTPIKPASIGELAKTIGVPYEIPSTTLMGEETVTFTPPSYSALRQVFELSQKYPMSAEQARSLYDILTSEYKKTVKKGWGPFKKKKTIRVRPHPEVLERELPKVIIPESLIAETQKTLAREAETLAPKLEERIRTVDIEKMRLPETPWLTEYRGITLAERARESARSFNEQMQTLTDWTKEVLNQLKNPDTAKSITLALSSSFITDVMNMIYNYSGGTLDIRSFLSQLYDVTSKSKEYLNNLSQMFSNLLNIKVDLLSDLQEALEKV